jgi:hypothetical protein
MGTLDRLSNEECINAYGPGDGLMSKRGNLLVVTKSQPANNNNTILLNFRYEYFVTELTGQNWVCSPELLNANDYKCDWQSLARTANENWNMGDIIPDTQTNRFELADEWSIDYCLSQTIDLDGVCQLQYSLVIMLTVLAANMTKFFVIFYFLYTAHDPVLATIGDGIASFLERPDPFTAGHPFLTRRSGRRFKSSDPPRSRRWKKPRTLRWWSGPSTVRWLITVTLCSLMIMGVSLLLRVGNQQITSANAGSPYALGFGNYNSAATIHLFKFNEVLTASDFTSNSLLIGMVFVANIPQVMVSCLYFAYNTIYTAMVSADEWSRFTTHRKTLRTTDPVGFQRSTYWLSLPLTYGLPLAAASSALHWLISSSLFISRTEVLDTTGDPESISFMKIGYSPLAILVSLVFGGTMVLAMIVNGARRLQPGSVLVANNSLAIAAACQRPEDDINAHLNAVRWGVVREKNIDGKGHCCFTSREVDPPEVGELYI